MEGLEKRKKHRKIDKWSNGPFESKKDRNDNRESQAEVSTLPGSYLGFAVSS